MLRLDTILLADDEPDLSEVMVAILTEAGYAVLTAADGYTLRMRDLVHEVTRQLA
jgi:DNA-binding response OmpR family regulator